MGKKTITVRIDEELLQKLRVVAAEEGRTTSSQVGILIRKCIKQFEQTQAAAQTRRRRARSAPAESGTAAE